MISKKYFFTIAAIMSPFGLNANTETPQEIIEKAIPTSANVINTPQEDTEKEVTTELPEAVKETAVAMISAIAPKQITAAKAAELLQVENDFTVGQEVTINGELYIIIADLPVPTPNEEITLPKVDPETPILGESVVATEESQPTEEVVVVVETEEKTSEVITPTQNENSDLPESNR